MVALSHRIEVKDPDVVAENRVWSFLGERPNRVRQTAMQVADCDREITLVDYDWRRGPSLAQSAKVSLEDLNKRAILSADPSDLESLIEVLGSVGDDNINLILITNALDLRGVQPGNGIDHNNILNRVYQILEATGELQYVIVQVFDQNSDKSLDAIEVAFDQHSVHAVWVAVHTDQGSGLVVYPIGPRQNKATVSQVQNDVFMRIRISDCEGSNEISVISCGPGNVIVDQILKIAIPDAPLAPEIP